MVDIVETDKYGLANTINGTIYIHPKLKEFPDIHSKVIRHEIEHTRQKSWMGQRKVDALTEIKFKDLYPFYKKYPSVFFKQHSPITYTDNTLLIEWSLIFLYSIYIGLGGLVYWIISIFSSDRAFFFKIVWYMFLIFMGIFFLYYVGKMLKGYVNEQAKKKVTKK